MGLSIFFLAPLLAISIFSLLSRIGMGETLYWIFWGGFSPSQIPETMLRAAPILITSFGLVAPYLARTWNIGSEGQMLLGAVASAWAGLHLGGLGILGISTSAVFGGVCGALWALIPAILKAYRGANEVFSTLMMNYLATYLVSYLLQGPLRSPTSLFPETAILSRDLWVEPLIPGTRLNAFALFSPAVIAPATYILVARSTLGIILRVAGEGSEKARYFGVDAGRVMLATMLFSGFLAGVAGSAEVLGIHHRALPSISQGYGYLAIPVAVISILEPRLILPLSIYLGGIVNGIEVAQMVLSIPSGISYVLQGVLLMAALPIARRR
jgi:simple sugar transport system permease protein